MKPIFEEEKWFFYNNTGVELPDNCWRDGSKIYLNSDKETLIINFKVADGKINIKKNKIDEVLAKYENKSLDQEIKEVNDRLNELEEESINRTIEYIKENGGELRLSHSGGKDSDVAYYIFKKAIKRYDEVYGEKLEYVIDFFNTTNDTPQTYKHIKEIKKYDNLLIHNPEMGWYDWLEKKKNYYLPSTFVRNCCSTYKEGQLNKILDKNKKYILFLGARKHESTKRKDYNWDLNEAWKISHPNKKLNVPENWKRFLPIVEFTDEEVWLYMLRENIIFNDQYKLGFNRTGCLICCYMSDYVDLLVKYYYPFLWKRWANIVGINYDTYNVEKRLKWSKEEYSEFGRWKTGMSKESEITSRKPTKESIKELAELKGVSEEVALKYFQKKCSCGKKLNPDEIAMYLKMFGRYEGHEDNRTYLCKNCLCESFGMTKDDYASKVREFRNQGCELF